MTFSGTLHAFEHWLLNWRRTWTGSLLTGFLLPVLYILGLGMAVGTYVDGSDAIGGVSYVAFIAPGLLASTAFQITSGELTWPVFAATRWGNQYRAMQSSPLSPGEILNGHLAYAILRGLLSSAVFLLIMWALGTVESGWAPLALLTGLLTSMSVAGAVYALACSVPNESALSMLHRFGVLPLTLFCAVFFPLSQLPAYIQPLAWVSPLWHGVELTRASTLGTAAPWPVAAHVAVLLVWVVAGWLLAGRRLRARLTV